jgi:hypothetical protein
LRWNGGRFFGGHFGFWARKTLVGDEHRTEVTEVTEAGLRLGGARLFGRQFDSGREGHPQRYGNHRKEELM